MNAKPLLGTDTKPPGLSAPSTQKGRSTRRRLMDAAEQLFEARGYANVRITDITEHAGISAGAFYRYFADRRQLTIELLREMTVEMYESIRSPFDESQPIRSVLESTRKYFEFYSAHRAVFGVLVELSQSDTEVAELWDVTKRAFYERIARSLQRGIAAGQLRADLNPEVAAEMLGSMTEFYAFQRFVLGGSCLTDASIDEATHTLATIWISGMSLHDAPSLPPLASPNEPKEHHAHHP